VQFVPELKVPLNRDAVVWADEDSLVVADPQTNKGARAKVGSHLWLRMQDGAGGVRYDVARLRGWDEEMVDVTWLYSGADLRVEQPPLEWAERVAHDEFVSSSHDDRLPRDVVQGIAPTPSVKLHFDSELHELVELAPTHLSRVQEARAWALAQDEMSTPFARRVVLDLSLFARLGSERWQAEQPLPFLPGAGGELVPACQQSATIAVPSGPTHTGRCGACGLKRVLSRRLTCGDAEYALGATCAAKVRALMDCGGVLLRLRAAVRDGATDAQLMPLLEEYDAKIVASALRFEQQE
jgi:hypothetical protein